MTSWVFILIGLMPSLATANSSFFVGNQGDGGAEHVFTYKVVLPPEPEDWIPPQSGTNSLIFKQCQLLVEMKLVTAPRKSYIFAGLVNSSGREVIIHLRQARFSSTGRPEISFEQPLGPGSIDLESQQYAWGFFSISDKESLKGLLDFKVHLPVQDRNGESCEIQGVFKKPDGVAEDSSTTTVWSRSFFSLGVAGDFIRSGSFFDFESTGSAGVDMSFLRMKTPTDGAYFSLSVRRLLAEGNGRLGGNPPYNEFQFGDVSFGLAQRRIHDSRSATFYRLGPTLAAGGPARRGADHKIQEQGPLKVLLGVHASTTYEYVYHRSVVDFSVGLTLFLKAYPFGEQGRQAFLAGAGVEMLRVSY